MTDDAAAGGAEAAVPAAGGGAAAGVAPAGGLDVLSSSSTATSSSAHTSPSSSSSSAEIASHLYPFASGPSIVLAAEKDMYYTKQLHQQLKELAETVLGPRRAELLGPEVQSLGVFLYYGLTVFAGMETLGQEYCSLMLVEEQPEGTYTSLSQLRRGMMVGWTVLFNYIAERILHRGGWTSDYNQLIRRTRQGRSSFNYYYAQQQQQQQQQAYSPSRLLHHSGSSSSSPIIPPSSSTSPPLTPPRESALDEDDDQEDYLFTRPSSRSSSRPRSSPPTTPSHHYPPSSTLSPLPEQAPMSPRAAGAFVLPPSFLNSNTSTRSNSISRRQQHEEESSSSSYLSRIRGLFRHFTSSFSSWVESHEDLLQHIIPESRELAFRMLQRFHLMFFFFTNRYYTLAMRLSRARTMYIKNMEGQRTSYIIIGAFIFLEMTFKALAALVHVTKAALVDSKAKEEEDELAGSNSEYRVPSGLGRGRTASIVSEGGSGMDDWRKCPLCMTKRKYPAVTPCGHVFCWDCLLSWCIEQPECPLCRSKVALQKIVHVPNLGINHTE